MEYYVRLDVSMKHNRDPRRSHIVGQFGAAGLCRPDRPSRTRSRTSGNSFATTGSQIGSSSPTAISSAIATAPGTASPASR